MQFIGENQKSSSSPLGILLINTGTPGAPTPVAVRRFLAQFLADRRVIEYPRWLWLPVLYSIILNVRPRRSARLYQRIWTEEGSPILAISRRLREKLQTELTSRISTPVLVELGMRYGKPSIEDALARFHHVGVERIVVLPLFPQYSGTTTGTALETVFEVMKTWRWMPSLNVISDYHEHSAYVEALAESIRQKWDGMGKFLFSFHGIPQGYVDAGDPYEDQCRRTATLVAERLDLEPESWSVAFQSRFGPQTWIQPYTDQILESWGREGLKHLHVVCPGFSVDCLETLDEIQNEGCHLFTRPGGGHFNYIPALNDSSLHINALTNIIIKSGNLHEE